ncbi:hypothetical protein Scep_010902 [Stephania cephalantha]|uniref:Uncharacterized protein n=1 Tax=Stephania cephalantha TaxID=152367 RepID=A0AAP0PHQ6_9MAGN
MARPCTSWRFLFRFPPIELSLSHVLQAQMLVFQSNPNKYCQISLAIDTWFELLQRMQLVGCEK